MLEVREGIYVGSIKHRVLATISMTSKARHKIPTKLTGFGRRSKAAPLSTEIAPEELPIDRKDTMFQVLVELIGDEAEEYRDYLTSADIDAVWEMVGMKDSKKKIILYLETLKERGDDVAEDPPYYQSSVFLSPQMYGLLEMEESRKGALIRTEKYVEGPVKCGKCTKNFLSSTTFNNKAFDEPQTTMYRCGTCGNTWFV